jgi:plasmid stabilization system protein ParE
MGNRQVEFHEAASLEFEAAFEWYFERSERAALRFACEIERAIVLIANAPWRFPAAPVARRGSCCKGSHSLSFTANFRRQFKSLLWRMGEDAQATGKHELSKSSRRVSLPESAN